MSGESILVVENEAIVARDIAEMLRDLGYVVHGTASSAREAFEMAATSPPDLVVMDIRLGESEEEDGIDAARAIRERIGTPTVFLSAYADDVTLERAKGAYPYGYLVKPLDERELHSTIQVALHRKRMETEGSAGEFSRVLEDLGGGHYALDREWRFRELSSAAEVLLGASRETLLGREIWQEYPELRESALFDIYHEALEHGTSQVIETYHLPARVRVRLRVEPTSTGLTVHFLSRSTG